MASVAIIGTCDTKLEELLFLRARILTTPGVTATLIDVGRHPVTHDAITIRQHDLLSRHGDGARDVSSLTRGEFIEHISQCAAHAVRRLFDSDAIQAIVSAGGSGGTSLAAAIMRDVLPIGFPKLIVSTMASGDTGPIVGESDITLMYSVVDIAGLNHILRDILSNAGAAISAAALSYAVRCKSISDTGKKRVGITMFGVTTPCVDAIRAHFASHYPDIETYIFHATGHGGRAMERLVREGQLDAVLDLTTTEICDHIVGGVLSAGPSRLDAAAGSGIPNIVSLGAVDMINFGPKNTVPERFQGRKLYEHNPIITLMRCSPDESKEIGSFICDKLRNAKRPDMVQVWLSRGGVSMLAVKGGPFEDAAADTALFDSIKSGLEGSGVEVIDDQRDVNDKGFARDIAEALAAKLGSLKSA